MIAIDEPALCIAHSLRRAHGRGALDECRRLIDRAVARQDLNQVKLWTEASARLCSGIGVRH